MTFFQTDERVKVNEHVSFVDHQTNMVRLAKQIARTAQDMVRHIVFIGGGVCVCVCVHVYDCVILLFYHPFHWQVVTSVWHHVYVEHRIIVSAWYVCVVVNNAQCYMCVDHQVVNGVWCYICVGHQVVNRL